MSDFRLMAPARFGMNPAGAFLFATVEPGGNMSRGMSRG